MRNDIEEAIRQTALGSLLPPFAGNSSDLPGYLEVVRYEDEADGPHVLYVRVTDHAVLVRWISENACDGGYDEWMEMRQEMGVDGALFTPRNYADWNDLYEAMQGACTDWFDDAVYHEVCISWLAATDRDRPQGSARRRSPFVQFVE